MQRQASTTIALLLLLMCGCSRAEYSKHIGGINLTVREPHDPKRIGHAYGCNGTHSVTVGSVEVSIARLRLWTNFGSYGAVNVGDDVLIEDGKVFVNGVERSPIPKSNTVEPADEEIRSVVVNAKES